MSKHRVLQCLLAASMLSTGGLGISTINVLAEEGVHGNTTETQSIRNGRDSYPVRVNEQDSFHVMPVTVKKSNKSEQDTVKISNKSEQDSFHVTHVTQDSFHVMPVTVETSNKSEQDSVPVTVKTSNKSEQDSVPVTVKISNKSEQDRTRYRKRLD